MRFHLLHSSSSILTDIHDLKFSFVFFPLENDLITYLSILNIILVFHKNYMVREIYDKD